MYQVGHHLGLFSIGVPLSIIALGLTRVYPHTRQRFIIPGGYQGDVYELHVAVEGVAGEKTLLGPVDRRCLTSNRTPRRVGVVKWSYPETMV